MAGYPLRRRIQKADRDAARAALDFKVPAGRRVVFAFGGSQGARTINRALVDALGALLPHRDRLFIIHGTGLRRGDGALNPGADVQARLAQRYAEEEPPGHRGVLRLAAVLSRHRAGLRAGRSGRRARGRRHAQRGGRAGVAGDCRAEDQSARRAPGDERARARRGRRRGRAVRRNAERGRPGRRGAGWRTAGADHPLACRRRRGAWPHGRRQQGVCHHRRAGGDSPRHRGRRALARPPVPAAAANRACRRPAVLRQCAPVRAGARRAASLPAGVARPEQPRAEDRPYTSAGPRRCWPAAAGKRATWA